MSNTKRSGSCIRPQKEDTEKLRRFFENKNSDLDVSDLCLNAQKQNLEFIHLKDLPTDKNTKDLLPQEIARRFSTIPRSKINGVIQLAISDPMDIDAMDTIRFILKEPVDFVIAPKHEIIDAIDDLYSNSTSRPDHAQINTNEEPIALFVQELIQKGCNQRASDIHIEPMITDVRIRFRVDGVLQLYQTVTFEHYRPILNRIKIMAQMLISEKRLPQEGRIKLEFEKKQIDLRISSIPTNHGESIVMRLLDQNHTTLDLSHLGLTKEQHGSLTTNLKQRDGMILVTGPTGSGKTTTLYSCLKYLNQSEQKIITVEDPVEYQLSGINQVQVKPDIGMTFSTALRAMLRQAPNTIMIGEIRDQETADIAINAALTGHLVLSTLHTNDAPSAITRLINIGANPFLISSALKMVIAQRLVRVICRNCKQKYMLDPAAQHLFPSLDQTAWEGTGCDHCKNMGYVGRLGIFESLPIDPSIQTAIHQSASSHTIRKLALSAGMLTLKMDALLKVKNGLTTLNEVMRVCPKEGSSL